MHLEPKRGQATSRDRQLSPLRLGQQSHHRLIRKSLRPEKFGKQCARHNAGIELEADDVRTICWPGITTKHQFGMMT